MSHGEQDSMELSIGDFPDEILYKLCDSFAEGDEQSRSTIASTHSMFGHNVYQTDRILTKLSHYIAEGRMYMVDKLIEIRPDLTFQVLSLVQKGLFTLAGSAEQDKMEQILKQYPQLFFTYDSLEDISGVRPVINIPETKGITIFQHTLWTGDVHYMCNMILDCLPKNEYGEEIRIELLRQFNELMDKGVIYELDGKIHKEKQFSLEPVIEALRTYCNTFENSEYAIQYWCEVIGLIQTHFPGHIRHQYCNEDWHPRSDDDELVRNLELSNSADKTHPIWNNSLQGLGSRFAISCQSGGLIVCKPYSGLEELTKIENLHTVRTTINLPDLIQRLNSPIQMKSIPMPVSMCTIS